MGDAGCEGRCVSALRYQWEGVMAGQVYLRGMSGTHLCPVQDRADREGWYRVPQYHIISYRIVSYHISYDFCG